MRQDIDNIIWFLTPSTLPPGVSGAHLTLMFLLRFAAYVGAIVLIAALGWRFRKYRLRAVLAAALVFPVFGLLAPLRGNITGDWPGEYLNFVWHIGPAWRQDQVLGCVPLYWLGSLYNARGLTVLEFTRVLAIVGVIGAVGVFFLALRICCGGLKPAADVLGKDNARYLLATATVCQPISFMFAGFPQSSYITAVMAPWVLWALAGVFFRQGQGKETRSLINRGALSIVLAVVAHYAHSSAFPIVVGMMASFCCLAVMYFWCREWRMAVWHGILAILSVLVFMAVGVIVDEISVRLPGVSDDPMIKMHSWPSWVPFMYDATSGARQTMLFSLGWVLFASSAVTHVSNAVLLVSGLWRIWMDRSRSVASLPMIMLSGASMGALVLFSPHAGFPTDLDIIAVAGLTVSAVCLGYLFAAERGIHNGRRFTGSRHWAIAVLAYSVFFTAGTWGLQETHGTYHLYYERLTGPEAPLRETPPNEIARQTVAFVGKIGFSAKPLAQFEPLVTTGWWGRGLIGDFVYVEYLKDRAIVLRYDHSGETKAASEPLYFPSGEVNDIVVAVDKTRNVLVVMLSGREVLRYEGYVHPFDSNGVAVGWNRMGWPRAAAVFSGHLEGRIAFGPFFPNGWEGLWRPGYD